MTALAVEHGTCVVHEVERLGAVVVPVVLVNAGVQIGQVHHLQHNTSTYLLPYLQIYRGFCISRCMSQYE